MMKSVSSYFPVVSKEMHAGLLYVSNLRENERMKAMDAKKLAAAEAVIRSTDRQALVALGGLNLEGIALNDGEEPEVPGEVIHVDEDRAFSAFRNADDSASDYSDVEEDEDGSTD